MSTTPTKELETFANPELARDYTIRMQIPEFTCLCPRTGQPDFATLDLEYVPDRLCVELKSLKLYIWSFRERGAFHEAVANEIADHLEATLGAGPVGQSALAPPRPPAPREPCTGRGRPV
jgi:7-cyano-7-deazaguanine reductase